MNREPKLLGYYNYTVILTYIGMLTGFAGIVYAFDGNPFAAIICLMIAGFCEMFDGTIASTRKRTEDEKYFGIQIDSLSDLICFGVLPGITVYSLNKGNNLVLGVAGFYVLCALIRLAFFNVDEQKRQLHSNEPRKIYYGLPVTMSALFIPVIYSLADIFEMNPGPILAVSLFLMAALFVTPFKLKKPKLVGKVCLVICGILELFLVVFSFADL